MPARDYVRGVRKGGRRGLLAPALLVSGSIIAAAIIFKRAPSLDPLQAMERASPRVVAEFDTVSVPVPLNTVPTGTKVSDITLKFVAYPREQLPEDALLNLDKYLDAYTTAPLPGNLPIFSTNLSKTQSSNPVVERIPQGMRAMTISVDATSSVEGWAGSGAMVDVLLVQKDLTTVIAEKVKILSAERSVVPVEGANAPNVPRTVTLLVTQDQCLAINTAIPLGKIAFALRGTQDSDSWNDAQYSADQLRRSGALVAIEQRKSNVTGYVRLKGDDSKSFALSDGKWIKAETMPEGFLLGEQR